MASRLSFSKFYFRFYVKPVMWVKAVDIVLDRLVVQGAELSTVVAISGSAQQHGSLYWSSYGVKTLTELDADKFLHTQIDDSAFTMTRTPIWMDVSCYYDIMLSRINIMSAILGFNRKAVH